MNQDHLWALVSGFVPRGTGLGVINCDRRYKVIRDLIVKKHRVAIIGYTVNMSQLVFLVSDETQVRDQSFAGCKVSVWYDGTKQKKPQYIAL
ncbi:hypothetical protein PG985_013684 [Apiospora marii]|uniref:uncharacterized protein n=1 Tax=Apiospora marii TaxID=335849 RepID=UPI00312F3D4F